MICIRKATRFVSNQVELDDVVTEHRTVKMVYFTQVFGFFFVQQLERGSVLHLEPP